MDGWVDRGKAEAEGFVAGVCVKPHLFTFGRVYVACGCRLVEGLGLGSDRAQHPVSSVESPGVG